MLMSAINQSYKGIMIKTIIGFIDIASRMIYVFIELFKTDYYMPIIKPHHCIYIIIYILFWVIQYYLYYYIHPFYFLITYGAKMRPHSMPPYTPTPNEIKTAHKQRKSANRTPKTDGTRAKKTQLFVKERFRD